MELVQLYKCFSDETRLRIVHLLAQGPLCVCHFQTILDAPQVAISKHLAYLRERGIVVAQRHEQWMVYRLANPAPAEFDRQLRCLQDCVQSHPLFLGDLRRLKQIRCGCDWLDTIVPATSRGRRASRTSANATP